MLRGVVRHQAGVQQPGCQMSGVGASRDILATDRDRSQILAGWLAVLRQPSFKSQCERSQLA